LQVGIDDAADLVCAAVAISCIAVSAQGVLVEVESGIAVEPPLRLRLFIPVLRVKRGTGSHHQDQDCELFPPGREFFPTIIFSPWKK